jgi:hypothetical protein
MDSLLRGCLRTRSTSSVVAALIFAFICSLSVARGGDEIGDGASGTALAVTGIPLARENSGLYGLGFWSFSEPHAHAPDVSDHAILAWLHEQCLAFRTHGHGGLGYGTLGYGEFGLYSGFYGFGLSFHLGYGYGGRSLGVGADGGYPFYGGVGYPAFGIPYDASVIGRLAVDQPVVSESEPGELGYSGDYGSYTGAIPYPETLFAPYASAAATGSLSTGPNPSAPARTRPPASVP